MSGAAAKVSRMSSDAVVTARVPRGIKQRGDAVLKQIGATPTKLVNAAYDFVLDHGRLPGQAASGQMPSPGVRTLDEAGKKRVRELMQSMRVGGGKAVSSENFDSLREAAMRERFPSLFGEETR